MKYIVLWLKKITVFFNIKGFVKYNNPDIDSQACATWSLLKCYQKHSTPNIFFLDLRKVFFNNYQRFREMQYGSDIEYPD